MPDRGRVRRYGKSPFLIENRNIFFTTEPSSGSVSPSQSKAEEQGKGGAAMESGIANTLGAAPDLSRYRAHVAHLDLPPDAEAELLRTVWRMMSNFVDRAFGDDPVQRSGRVVDRSLADASASPEKMLRSRSIQNASNERALSGAFQVNAAGKRRKEDS